MILETQKDRENEERIIATFAECRAMKYSKLEPPTKYVVDFLLLNGQGGKMIRAVAEAKARDCEKAAWDTLLISAHKIMHGLSLAKVIGVPFLLVIEWHEGIYYRMILQDEKFPASFTGRTDLGIAGDIEPCLMIPIDDKWCPA